MMIASSTFFYVYYWIKLFFIYFFVMKYRGSINIIVGFAWIGVKSNLYIHSYIISTCLQPPYLCLYVCMKYFNIFTQVYINIVFILCLLLSLAHIPKLQQTLNGRIEHIQIIPRNTRKTIPSGKQFRNLQFLIQFHSISFNNQIHNNTG